MWSALWEEGLSKQGDPGFPGDRVYCWETCSSTMELGKSSVVQHIAILQQPWHMSTIIEYREKMTLGP